MARINVESSISSDSRFQDLIIKLQCKDRALGSVVRAWQLAQKHYLKEGVIPFHEWQSQGCRDEIIEVGLAEKRENGIYMKGSSEQFQWLRQKSDAGKRPRKKVERTYTDVNGTQRDGSSLLFTPFSSLSSPDSKLISPRVAKRKRSQVSIQSVLLVRKEMHLEIHGVEPIGGPQVNGILSGLVREVGEEDSIAILRYFYKVPNSFYKTRGHDVRLLVNDKAKLLTEVRRQSPIIPDGREESFKTALKSQSRQDEIERHFSSKEKP